MLLILKKEQLRERVKEIKANKRNIISGRKKHEIQEVSGAGDKTILYVKYTNRTLGSTVAVTKLKILKLLKCLLNFKAISSKYFLKQ